MGRSNKSTWADTCSPRGLHAARPALTLYRPPLPTLHLQQPRDVHHLAALYDTLARQTGSPIVSLNRAIAVAELDGPDAGLAILDGLDLENDRYFHCARAELLRHAGRNEEARHAYRRALRTRPDRRRTAILPGQSRAPRPLRLTETPPSGGNRESHALPPPDQVSACH